MALKDLKSDLSWYGKTPPAANNIENIDHKGFVANIMPIGTGRPDSQFIGIKGIEYKSTSILGTLSVLSQPDTTTKFNYNNL